MRECLEQSVLKAYASGRISREAASEVESHLSECEACLALVDSAVLEEDSLFARLGGMTSGSGMVQDLALVAALASLGNLSELPTIELEPSGNDSEPMPQQIRDYQFVRKLDGGGMGVVYLALHTRLDKYVAVKVLPRERSFNVEAIARFEREMRVVGKLQHPHIVQALDAGQEAGIHFLVMEYVDGVDLKKLIRKLRRLELGQVCELIRQAALGLGHAHENGMVHRDVKPSNLMISSRGQVKVLDLGLAQFWRPFSKSDSLTETVQVLGTLAYMSPEQFGGGGQVGNQADIFSLGVSLYELLAGQLPVESGQIAIAMPDIRTYRDDLPPDLRQLLNAMLERNPAHRPADMATIAAALAPWCQDVELSPLLARYYDPSPLASDDSSLELAPPPLNSHTKTAGLSTTLPIKPPPLPGSKSAAEHLVRPAASRPRGPIWHHPAIAALAGAIGALCVALLIVSWWNPVPELPPDPTPSPAAVENSLVIVETPLAYVHDLLQGSVENTGGLVAVSLADGTRMPLRPGENLLRTGTYRLENPYWELQLEPAATQLVLESGKQYYLRTSIDFGSPLQYPTIPTQAGASVSYAGSLWRLGMPADEKINYKLDLQMIDEEPNMPGYRWLKIHVTTTNSSYSETGYLLLDAELFNHKQELKLAQGWLTAESPAIETVLNTRRAGTPPRLVAALDVHRADPLQQAADSVNLSLPPGRVSVQDVLLLVFGVSVDSHSDAASRLRAMLPKKNFTYLREIYAKGSKPLECFLMKAITTEEEATPLQPPAQYELWLNPLIPFRFVQVDVKTPILSGNLSYDKHLPADPPGAPASRPPLEQLAREAAWFNDMPEDDPWDLAWLGPHAPAGQWASFEVSGAFNRRPAEVFVRLLGTKEVNATERYRWLEVEVRQRGGNQPGSRQVARIKVNELLYPQQFEIVEGWIRHGEDVFPYPAGGDSSQLVEQLYRLDQQPPADSLTVFDALEILFHAEQLSPEPGSPGLGNMLRDRYRLLAGSGKTEYLKKHLPGHAEMQTLEAREFAPDDGAGDTIVRCRQVPLGLSELRLRIEQPGEQPAMLNVSLLDYGTLKPLDTPVSNRDWLDLAATTQAKLEQSAARWENFHLLTVQGKYYWAEYFGNFDSGGTNSLWYTPSGAALRFAWNDIRPESLAKKIRQGRLFRLANAEGRWFRARLEFFQGQSDRPILVITDSGQSGLQVETLYWTRHDELTLHDQEWINYIEHHNAREYYWVE